MTGQGIEYLNTIRPYRVEGLDRHIRSLPVNWLERLLWRSTFSFWFFLLLPNPTDIIVSRACILHSKTRIPGQYRKRIRDISLCHTATRNFGFGQQIISVTLWVIIMGDTIYDRWKIIYIRFKFSITAVFYNKVYNYQLSTRTGYLTGVKSYVSFRIYDRRVADDYFLFIGDERGRQSTTSYRSQRGHWRDDDHDHDE